VAGLNPGSPAVEAGLQANDILLKLADTPLAAPDDVAKGLKAAGEKDVPLEIIRGGKRETLRVRPRYRVTFGPARTEKRDFFIGVEVRPLDDAMRSHLSLAAGQGLVATRIIDDSPALKAGLKPHDILMKLGDKPLADTETLVAQVQASQGKPVDLEIVRGGKTMTIPVTPVPRPVMPEEAQWIQSQHVKLYQVPHGLSGHSETQALQGWVQSRAAPQQAHLRYMEALQNAHAPGGASPLDKKLDTLIEEVKRLRKEVEELKSAKK
jgi:C-terminal processing protease CtpA/Prc